MRFLFCDYQMPVIDTYLPGDLGTARVRMYRYLYIFIRVSIQFPVSCLR